MEIHSVKRLREEMERGESKGTVSKAKRRRKRKEKTEQTCLATDDEKASNSNSRRSQEQSRKSERSRNSPERERLYENNVLDEQLDGLDQVVSCRVEGFDDGGEESTEEGEDGEEGLEPPESLFEGEGGAGRRDASRKRKSARRAKVVPPPRVDARRGL